MSTKKVDEKSKTFKNLNEALAGESMAALRYMFYATKAKKDGYEYIADLLTRISHNEIQHAKIWYKILNGGISDTLKNIKSAANGEKYEWEYMYENFKKDAKEEGYDDIAKLFEGVLKIEKEHEKTYNEIIEMLEKDEMFSSNEECCWICRNCGHIHFGKKPPESCPVCSHLKSFFERY